MKFRLALLIFVTSFSFAFGDSTKCADFSGKLHYETWSYSGGAVPFPGMVVGKQFWYYNGRLAGLNIIRAGSRYGHGEEFPSGAIIHFQGQFDEDSKKVVKSQGTPGAGSAVYSIRVTNLPEEYNMADNETYLICAHDWMHMAP